MSKGGSTTSNTQIPAWAENAAIENINKARGVSEIGYVPYYGPEVAAFSPMQEQSMRTTGGAASAFGMAPKGFDATAGIPEAETYAGGIRGYSSMPLYREALEALKTDRPAQYKALTDMFINPTTGASPQGNYGATPAQVEQMISNSGGGDSSGGGGSTPYVSGSSDGDYYGVNDEYNPYKYNTPTEDISGDSAVDYRDMSFGEDGRRDIPWTENVGDFLNPFSGIEKAVDFGGGLLFDMQGKGDAPMTQAEAMNSMNAGSDRYNQRVKGGLAGDYGSDYGTYDNWDFSEATTPTQVEPVAAPDLTFPTGVEEDLNLSATSMPYADQVNSAVVDNTSPVMRGLLADQLTSEYDLQTGLQDEIAQKKAAKKKRDRPPEKKWSKPKSNGYAGQSGNKSSQGAAKTGYGFGL